MVRSLRGEVVAVTDTESLGDEWAADRAFMEANGIRSLLELPMVRDGLTTGSVGFDWLEHAATWTSEDLTVLGVLGSTFSQLLARKDAEVALERTVADSQTRFAALLDNIPDPVMRVGPDGEVLYANPAAEQILARAATTAAGSWPTARPKPSADRSPSRSRPTRSRPTPTRSRPRPACATWRPASCPSPDPTADPSRCCS